jgi:hypothetical protein
MITFDAAGAGNNNPVTSLTYSHTCTSNNNRFLVVAVWTEQTGDIVTGVTYNGVAMTRVATVTQGTQRIHLYILVNPATGTNDVVVSTGSSANIHSVSASYYDAKQSAQPNAFNTNVQASGATLTLQATVTKNGSLLISCAANEGNGISASTGTTNRTGGSGIIRIGDSNGKVNRGVRSMVWTPGNTSQDQAGIIISVTPVFNVDSAAIAMML